MTRSNDNDNASATAEVRDTKKVIRTALGGIADNVRISADGMVTAKRGYFYRHGMTAEKFGMAIWHALNAKGITANKIESRDEWKAWPKDSNFIATFQI